jgi:hypothetical protein
MTNENDQFIIADEIVPDDQLSKISKLGVDFVIARNEINRLKNMIELREKAFKNLSEVVIPEAMQSVNMKSFELANGFKLEVKPFVVVTLPKENSDIADTWLDENGHSGMMKHHIDVYIPKGTNQSALSELTDRIAQLGYEYSDNKTIHYQTLLKWGREMTEEGEQIPEDIFKVYRGYKTEIKT